MAVQSYRAGKKHPLGEDLTVGQNAGTKSTAPGHEHAVTTPPPGGENKTIAPKIITTSGDERILKSNTAWGRAGDQPQGQNPGRNGFGLASSLPAGQAAPRAGVNPMAPTDVLLDEVIRGGAKGAQLSDDFQTRNADYADAKFPAHPHMKDANVGGAPRSVVPSSTGSSPYGDELRRRQAALARDGK